MFAIKKNSLSTECKYFYFCNTSIRWLFWWKQFDLSCAMCIFFPFCHRHRLCGRQNSIPLTQSKEKTWAYLSMQLISAVLSFFILIPTFRSFNYFPHLSIAWYSLTRKRFWTNLVSSPGCRSFKLFDLCRFISDDVGIFFAHFQFQRRYIFILVCQFVCFI